MERFCAFVENKTLEPLEIPKISTIYCNDPLLRAKKRLGSHAELSKRALGAEGRSGSPSTSTEVIAKAETAEKAQEEVVEEEGHEASATRKSVRLARGKAKVVLPASPKKNKDFPKLDDVPRKRRKFLDASTTAVARVDLPHPSVTEHTKPVVTSTIETQLILCTPEPIVEVAPLAAHEAFRLMCRRLNHLHS